MSSKGKCTAKGGPATCGRANCPERIDIIDYNIPDVPALRGSDRPKPPIPFGAWTEKDTVLFKTVHGSKLYGLAKANSDDDYYVVTPTRHVSRQINAKQQIDGLSDITTVDFSSFVTLAGRGVPQVLETMFSRKARGLFEDYRQGYYASDPEVIHTYMRTIKSFSLTDLNNSGIYKRKRHALRLSLNLEELMYTGRFNPTLSKVDALRISRLAYKEGNDYFKELKRICPIEVNWDESARRLK